MVGQEELMALYGIARDELDGVSAACEKLERTIKRLEQTESSIENYAKGGIRASLNDFQNKFDVNLRESLLSTSKTLENAVSIARSRLDNLNVLYLVICFLLGLVVGLGALGWFVWDRMNLLNGQKVTIYRELVSYKAAAKARKPKVKHRRVEPTQSSEAPEDGEGLVGGEEVKE